MAGYECRFVLNIAAAAAAGPSACIRILMDYYSFFLLLNCCKEIVRV